MKLVRKYLDAATEQGGGDYGYSSDEVKVSPFNFGLNAGVAKLTKFEWIPNGGKDGAEQEALDIVFTINNVDKNYRMFPVVKAFGKNNEEITDRNAPEFKEAITDFNARITHILHAFLDSDVLKASLSRPFKSFKDYAQFCANLLPKNFSEQPLDIFLQYQWQPSANQTRTFLEIPKKMKYGAWLKPAQPGTWTENKADNIQENTRKALWYTNENGEEHPFVKNGWFMLSNFANQQRGADDSGADSSASDAMNSGANVADSSATDNSAGAAPLASAW